MAQKYKNFKSKSYWRTNQAISAQTLRVIGPDGKQIGVLTKEEALNKAQELELDLVEVVPQAVPPVARIIDFAKFKYQEAKKEREAKFAERKGSEIKEIWLTPFMADNDFQVRLGRILEFLGDGNKVRIVVKFTFRQLTHKEFGYELCKRVINATRDISKVDSEPKFLGRQLLMTITPVKKKKVEETKNEETEKNKTQSI